MNTNLQEGQKVQTPDGLGLVASILGEQVTVKLDDGREKVFEANEVIDDADQG